jgi:hypothetical protein
MWVRVAADGARQQTVPLEGVAQALIDAISGTAAD